MNIMLHSAGLKTKNSDHKTHKENIYRSAERNDCFPLGFFTIRLHFLSPAGCLEEWRFKQVQNWLHFLRHKTYVHHLLQII